MSLMSAIRRLVGVRGAAVGEATLAASSPQSWMAFGGPPPSQPGEPDVVETTSQYDDRQRPDLSSGSIHLTLPEQEP
jgi:hypothetical protein